MQVYRGKLIEAEDNMNFSFREEFVNGMLEHPVTSKILMIKKIDAILDTM